MAPNIPQYQPTVFVPMARHVSPPTPFVSVDRLYEIAAELAKFEMSQEKLVDNCVSMLDHQLPLISEPSPYTQRYGLLVGPPPPPATAHGKGEKSYCEVVSVPTSNHVAQIVGKQGSKIKLMRAKSKTYIQTPVSGEEPVFIITGRREDVLKVKAEILSVSDHFSAIQEERKHKFRQNVDIPGAVTLNLMVPSFLIGLIVGRNGQTIRSFQLTTQTSIETPKNNNCPFKISGIEANVRQVKDMIIEHVKSKTQRQFRTTHLPNGDITLSII